MNQPEIFQRHLKLPGCLNLRELGGYTTSEEKQIRWRTLLRSDSLHRLPSSSQQHLLDYGIRTIIDLRSPSEVSSRKYALSQIPEIKYFNLPLIDDRSQVEFIKNKRLFEHNRFFLEKRSPVIKNILETIACQKTAVVIHCAAGKDRTGIIIALLLALANVSVETIAEDYQLSDRYLAFMYDKIRQQAIKEGFAHLLESSPQTIIDTFAYLDRNHGGVNSYLACIGIDSAKRIQLKTMLVL
ncbi:tyrosine-protein phosphatase [Pleurocapsa sp. PCC 7319]|uniref:tyrosine-protein phosphatase n=1 Tax=Pleurocapsa sp. PCC 7319 TaxID=118161 RepID=UPI0003479AA7|nr:tyrosine-protein phosphatase [Pleurocapsa sp. PCC 7319]